MLKTGVAAVLATAFMLVLLPSALFAATADDAVSPAAVCIECCEGDGVCQALASLAELRSTVEATVPESGIANSLEVKADAATAAVLAGRYGAALRQLDAFGNEVSAKGSAKPPPDWTKFVQALHEITKGIVANLRV